MKPIGVWFAAALLTAGCSVALDAAGPAGPRNVCGASGSCGDGATCVDDTCVATRVDLSGLLVEVRPHANASFGSTTSYLFSPEGNKISLVASGTEAFTRKLDPILPKWVAIHDGIAQVHEDTPLGQSCPLGPDRAVPAHFTFYRVAPFAGLPFDPITASTGDNGRLDVDLVPGTYDVYIEPKEVDHCNDNLPFPPAFFPGQVIGADASGLWKLPVVGTLTGTLTDLGAAVDGAFKLSLVEPARGLRISANPELKKLDPSSDSLGIRAQISAPDAGAPPPILRLAPDKTTTDDGARATAYWTLAGTGGTTTNPEVGFSLLDLYAKPVPVTLDVFGSDGFTRIPATITVQSTELTGTAAKTAAFAIDNLSTDQQGVFTAFLPPGAYDIRATPIDNGLAITDQSFPPIQVGTTCFCGQHFSLAPKVTVSGLVMTPTRGQVAGVTVSLAPTVAATRGYWSTTHALPALTARQETTTSGSDGSFSMLVDPGMGDLVVQTDPTSGFPWLVKPRLTPTADARLVLQSPAVLTGTVRDPQGLPVANAEVNAWFPVRDPQGPGGLAGTVVKIATTQTDDNGAYKLLLPSSI
jgi:hypothetical protein